MLSEGLISVDFGNFSSRWTSRRPVQDAKFEVLCHIPELAGRFGRTNETSSIPWAASWASQPHREHPFPVRDVSGLPWRG